MAKDGKSRTFERARYTLPDVIDPPRRRCITIEIPDNLFHYAAFYGQMLALSRAYVWGNDTDHTALAVAAVWKRVLETLTDCEAPPLCGGVDEGVEQLIRQNPTNPCLLETSINGTDWCVFADLSKCIPSGTQPGSGTPQPPAGGGQACYHAQFTASNKWLLPTLVNTGDVIQITNAKGAASDGTVSWFCPNGALFQLGACFGSGSTSSGDPLNTQPHMTLLAHIGSVYYNVYNTSLTVPSGVANAQVEFQVNDSTLSDNYGDLTFDVCVTNNAAAVWEHVFDFKLTDGGWRTNPGSDGNRTYAIWNAGIGWVANCTLDDGAANYYQMDSIRINTARATTFTSAVMTYTRTVQNTPVAAISDQIYLAPTQVAGSNIPGPTGTNILMTWSGSQAVSSGGLLQLSIAQDFQHVSGHSCPLATPAAIISRVVFTGTGNDPF